MSAFGISYLLWANFQKKQNEPQPFFCGVIDNPIQRNERNFVGYPLFKQNCIQCHALDQVVVGPALKNTYKNWTKNQFSFLFKSDSKNRLQKNPRYKRLKKEFKMTFHEEVKDYFSDSEINQLFSYLDSVGRDLITVQNPDLP